jgi:hypothetical protein
MKTTIRNMLLASTVCLCTVVSPVQAKMVYLDKLDKKLDDRWNALDVICRGEPGDSEASKLACNQRSAVSKIIKQKGCRNIYPATNPHDTSYWICKK